MAKKKGGRYTPPKAPTCRVRSMHSGKLLPHSFTSRKRLTPKTNDTMVIADMEYGEPGPWQQVCSWCGKAQP